MALTLPANTTRQGVAVHDRDETITVAGRQIAIRVDRYLILPGDDG